MPMFIPSKNAALDRVNQYISEKLIHYQSKRNHDFGGVDANYVSYLSPYLRHRVITEEYVIKQAPNYHTKNTKDEQKIRKEYKYSTSGVFKKRIPMIPPMDLGPGPYCP